MFLEILWRDITYGARMLWQKPAYSVVAVLTLALGIGANTAIFSVVNTVLLKPLPFAEPERLMALGQQSAQNRIALSQFSFQNFADVREHSRSFDHLAAYYNLNLTLTGDREAQLLRGARSRPPTCSPCWVSRPRWDAPFFRKKTPPAAGRAGGRRS